MSQVFITHSSHVYLQESTHSHFSYRFLSPNQGKACLRASSCPFLKPGICHTKSVYHTHCNNIEDYVKFRVSVQFSCTHLCFLCKCVQTLTITINLLNVGTTKEISLNFHRTDKRKQSHKNWEIRSETSLFTEAVLVTFPSLGLNTQHPQFKGVVYLSHSFQ